MREMGKRKMRVLDLFAGQGGMTLGLHRAGGFETAAFCEIDPFARAILAKNWKKVPRYEDITTADFESLGPVDLVAGGFPCQDISLAGNGAGLAGSRSGLFWHLLRAAGMVGWPKLLLENVAELLNRGLGTVLGALAALGYDAEWHCIPASAVGAPHRRDRVWIIADPQREGWQRPLTEYGLSCSISEAFPVTGDGSIGGWCRMAEGLNHLRGGDGLPIGMERSRIRLCGNAVVPQIPELIGRSILRRNLQIGA
jgi:DNA (cytosine-5)-methyltransferase 1